MTKFIPQLEMHVSTDGPTWTPFHSRSGCAALLRAKHRAGLVTRTGRGVYQLHCAGCLSFVITKPAVVGERR